MAHAVARTLAVAFMIVSALPSPAADGTARDRAAMQTYMQGIMNGVREWKQMTLVIDSLHVVGDTAVAIVRQFLDRMALRPDNRVHHVQTWVTQRETWLREGGRWLMWRVDLLRDQRASSTASPADCGRSA